MHLSRTGEAYFVSEAPSESGGALSYQCCVMSPAVRALVVAPFDLCRMLQCGPAAQARPRRRRKRWRA